MPCDITPADYGLDSGQTYSVTPNDYGSNYFNHWHDSYDAWDGSRARTVNLPPATSQAYTSVYYSSPAQGFEITSTDANANPLTGFYVPISPCGGDNQCSAYTPAWFTYLYGSSYTVTPNDYGNYKFVQWQDTGSSIRSRTITPSTSFPAYNAIFGLIGTWANSGTDYQVSTDTTTQIEPTIAVRTTDTSNLIVGNMEASGITNACDIFRSIDSGTSWSKVTTFPLSTFPDGNDLSDAVVTSDAAGNFWFTCFEESNQVGQFVDLAESTDGSSWPSFSKQVVNSGSPDKPWIVADTHSGSSYKNSVYGCWQDLSTKSVYFKRLVNPSSSQIPYDSDSQKYPLDTSTVNALFGCSIAVGPNGEVYVAWSKDNGSGGGTIYLKRNLSGGDPSSWSGPYPVGTYASLQTAGCDPGYECLGGVPSSNFRVFHYPSVAVDSTGAVHVTWMTNGGSTGADVLYTNSNSCGSGSCTFTTPAVKVDLDTGGGDQWEPAITVSATGNVIHISAYDRQGDANNVYYQPYDYYCNYGSQINCLTSSQWANIPITTKPSTNLDGRSFIDDYHGITTSSALQAYSDWTDSRDIHSSFDYNIYAERTVQ